MWNANGIKEHSSRVLEKQMVHQSNHIPEVLRAPLFYFLVAILINLLGNRSGLHSTFNAHCYFFLASNDRPVISK
jgi:hypothetical protein